ncbi:MAG TPA: signal recognition particle-docking protein FtsY [Oligoflexia bacterium]|nr:signal recognition particle-docking protein FtsY [Oligoflexia bacterium]HMP48000.1 signal recognition particle-docking protein FtsY [Oligoflexia bacterium]
MEYLIFLLEPLLSLMTVSNSWKFTITGLFLVVLAIIIEILKNRKKNPSIQSLDNSQFENQSYESGKSFPVTVLETVKSHELLIESPEIKGNTDRSLNLLQNDQSIVLLSDKLARSRNSFWAGLRDIFKRSSGEASNIEDVLVAFEELLIESDLGVRTSTRLISEIKSETGNEPLNSQIIEESLREKILGILYNSDEPEIEPCKVQGQPKVILVVGVNGAGKTTTIGKLAFQYQAQGKKVLIAACDTFRAAAAGQLEIWKDRAAAAIEKGSEGEKPSTVAYRAVNRAKDENFDVLLIDTAGRLHTRVNLMKELSGILSIISREQPGAPHETILVVDGSSGQNALQQAREFNASVGLTGIVITKLDGTPKGGIVIAIKDELGLPVRYIGVGESVADLRPFDAEEFVDALIGSSKSGSSHGQVAHY